MVPTLASSTLPVDHDVAMLPPGTIESTPTALPAVPNSVDRESSERALPVKCPWDAPAVAPGEPGEAVGDRADQVVVGVVDRRAGDAGPDAGVGVVKATHPHWGA